MVIKLLPYLWHAWWRKTKQRGVWHGANTATVTVIALFTVVAVMVAAIFAAKAYWRDDIGQASIMLEFCLNTVMVAWLSVPVMIGASIAEGRGLQPVRLGQFPFGMTQLMGIGLLGHLVQPIYWLLMAGSVMVFLPLFAAPNPALGVLAAILFLLISVLAAWSVELFGGALFSTRRGREIMMVLALLLLVPMFILLNSDFDYTQGHLFITTLGREFLLLNDDGTSGILVNMRAFSPSVIVSEAARGQAPPSSLALMAVAVLLLGWLGRVSLRRVMLNPPAGVSGRGKHVKGLHGWSWLPSDVGPLVVKEVRYLSRTLDHLMGVGMGLVGFVWVFVKPEHLPWVLPLGMVNIIFNESAIPLNVFGLDGSGHNRYHLIPLGSRQVLRSKNLAFFILAAVQIAPLVLAGFLKGEPGIALACLFGTAAVCLVIAGGGNIASIKSPAPRAFFNFDSKEQTGGGLTLFLTFPVWILHAFLYFLLGMINIWAAVAGQMVMLVGAWFVYRSLLGKAESMFAGAAENMREKLGVE